MSKTDHLLKFVFSIQYCSVYGAVPLVMFEPRCWPSYFIVHSTMGEIKPGFQSAIMCERHFFIVVYQIRKYKKKKLQRVYFCRQLTGEGLHVKQHRKTTYSYLWNETEVHKEIRLPISKNQNELEKKLSFFVMVLSHLRCLSYDADHRTFNNGQNKAWISICNNVRATFFFIVVCRIRKCKKKKLLTVNLCVTFFCAWDF